MDLDHRLGHQVDPADVVTLSRWAEDMGFRSLWGSESTTDPFLPIAHAAPVSTTLELGTGIAVAFGRTPYATAQSAWYLHRISNGRFVLGLGTQVRAHIERRFGTTWHGAGKPLVDYIACCREIWAAWAEDRQPHHQGPWFRCTLTNPEFAPMPLPEGAAPIPVWFAAVGPTLVRTLAPVCEGIQVHAFHTPAYLRDVLLPAAREARAAAGVEGAMRLSSPSMAGVVHDDTQERELRDYYRGIIAFYGSTPSYAPVLASVGYEDLQPRLHELSRAKRWDEMATLVPDDLVDTFVTLGDGAHVGHTLKQRYEGLLTQCSLYRLGDRFMDDDDWQALVSAARS